MKVSQKEIAKECGVSTYTVSSALRDKPDIGTAIKKKVLTAARRLGYNTGHRLSGYTNKRVKTIGLVLPGIADDGDPFFSRAVFSLKSAASRKGHEFILYSLPEINKKVVEEYHLGSRHLRCDGLVYFCPTEN